MADTLLESFRQAKEITAVRGEAGRIGKAERGQKTMKILVIDYGIEGSTMSRTLHYENEGSALTAYRILADGLADRCQVPSLEYPVSGGVATMRRSALLAVGLLDADQWEDMQVTLAKRNAALERRQKDATGGDLGFQGNGG